MFCVPQTTVKINYGTNKVALFTNMNDALKLEYVILQPSDLNNAFLNNLFNETIVIY